MNKKRLLLVLLLACWQSASAEMESSLLMNPQWINYNKQSVFAVPDSLVAQPPAQSRQILEWKTEYHGLNLMGNWNYTLDNAQSSSKGSMLEAYFSTSWNNIDFSLGKKIISWGTGYGFRPTDVIFNQDLQSTSKETFEGVPQFSLNYYLDMGEIALVAVPDSYQGDMLFGRYFESFEQYDLQLLAGYSQQRGTQLGAAGVWIVNDSLALHFDATLSEKYQKEVNSLINSNSTLPLANNNPFVSKEYQAAVRSLVGLNYSWGENNNIIVEYWYDDFAYSKTQWQDLIHLAEKQRQLLSSNIPAQAVYGNLAWNLQAMQSIYLLQHNLFLLWSQQGDDGWLPSLSVLYAPEDGGVINTLELSNNLDWMQINIGYRHFGGKADSVYAQLLPEAQFYFNFSRSF